MNEVAVGLVLVEYVVVEHPDELLVDAGADLQDDRAD